MANVSEAATSTRVGRRQAHCLWCGQLIVSEGPGRNRRYCKQSCRQRAYEQRSQTSGTAIPDDAVILSKTEADDLIERLYLLRCAAEDVLTAIDEGAPHSELGDVARELVQQARTAERLR